MTGARIVGEDGAWLRMEDAANPMVISGMLHLADRISASRLHALLDERLARLERFRMRVVEPRGGVARWERDPDFDVARHVEHVVLDREGDEALRAFVGNAVSSLLPRDRPLWRVYVIESASTSTILYRTHHAIADGFALLGVLLSLCGNATSPGMPVTNGAPRERPKRVELLRTLARVAMLPADPRTALKGPLSTTKRVAWTAPIPLAALKAAAGASSATVNDLLVAAVTGALRRYLERNGDHVDHLELRAMVPVNLRRALSPDELGNHFGLFVLPLPVSARTPSDRLAQVKARMDRLKKSPEAFVTHGVLRVMGFTPRRVEDLGVRFFGKKPSLVLTNVPGPRDSLTFCGARVERIVFWVPQAGRMGLGVSIFSYAGAVTLGVITDAGLVPDPERLIADLDAEIEALAGHPRPAIREIAVASAPSEL